MGELILRTSRGTIVRKPTLNNIEAVLEALPRDAHVIIEREGEGSLTTRYFQVWLRPDGTYQVEYRDGSADEHYQSRTISRVKAANALASWAADTEGAGLWRSGFDWTPIGQWFTQD